MRTNWMMMVLTLGCVAVPGSAWAQPAQTADNAGTHVDAGLRFGALTGLTGSVQHELLGYEVPVVGVGEVGPGGSFGLGFIIEPAAWPVTIRTTVDWTFLTTFRVEPSCADDPTCEFPHEERDYGAVRAFADLLWYAAPRDSRLRPFVVGGVGVTASRIAKPRPEPNGYCGLPSCERHDPFFGSRTDPAVRGAAGVDVRVGNARLAAEVAVYGSAKSSHDDRPVPGWNNVAVLSIGTRTVIN